MNTLQVTYQENYAIVQLDRGNANTINLEMLKELEACFSALSKNDAVQGVLLTGKPNFFSAGLDVIELYNYNEETIKQLFTALFEAVKTMISFKKPLVTAITGHCPAGGCVLSICTDYRVMSAGNYRIGLNEVPVGIVMPPFIYALYAYWLGEGKATQYVLDGKLFLAEEALNVGLVNEVVAMEEVENQALAQLKKYMKFSANTWQTSKLNMRTNLLKHFEKLDEQALNVLLRQWWSDDTRNILGALVAKLTAK